MDSLIAKQLENELQGKTLHGYVVGELLNNGKSAAVFKATKHGFTFALKVFDNELVERFGHEIQTKRIEQEIALKNHDIKNLVKIHEGGSTTVEGSTYYYIIMDFIDGMNLKDFITTQTYDESFVKNVLKTLYQTTEDLISKKNIAHRDIKPENIMVDNKGDVILMDLGVLKLIGATSFSDEEEKQFVGTLRYAPPEFLIRKEDDNESGWRAVNLYQIGAVSHDLIMKKELFEEKKPYPNLVIAIKDDVPSVSNETYSFEILQLTRDLLSKDFKNRLMICTKERIIKVLDSKSDSLDDIDQELEDILKMRVGHQAKFDEIEKLRRDKDEIKQKQRETGSRLDQTIDRAITKLQERQVFKDFEKSDNFHFQNDRLTRSTEDHIQNHLYELKGDLQMGFSRSLLILVRMSNSENDYCEIQLVGIFPSVFKFNKNVTRTPIQFFQDLSKEITQRWKTQTIYQGVVEFDDAFEKQITIQLAKLIKKALQTTQPEVESELKWREEMTKSPKASHSRVTLGHRSILIDSF